MPEFDKLPRGKQSLIDADGDQANICEVVGGIVTQEGIAHLVNIGRVFTASHLFTGVADDGYAYIRIKTHVNYHAFLSVSVESESKVYGYLYEDATFSGDGTILTAYNNDRSSVLTANTLLYYTPTVNTNGTLVRTAMLGSAGKFTESGGSAASIYARKLKKGTEYLLAIQNKGGAAKDIAIRVRFFEINDA